MRKTVEIEAVKKAANDLLVCSADQSTDIRRGASLMIERILHDCGQYRGFRYLTKFDMEKSMIGKTVGINYDEQNNHNFDGCDETRRQYL